MAQITITEILGSDDIRSSRAVLVENDRKLAEGINKIETYLNTDTEGGELTIGKFIIEKNTNAVTKEIFYSEASGKFNGNLKVLRKIVIGESNLDDSSEIKHGLKVNGNLDSQLFSLIGKETFEISEEKTIEVDKLNNILLNWDGYNIVTLNNGKDGQVLFIKNNGIFGTPGTITIKNIIEFDNINSENIEKITYILIFDEDLGKWLVASVVVPEDVTYIIL